MEAASLFKTAVHAIKMSFKEVQQVKLSHQGEWLPGPHQTCSVPPTRYAHEAAVRVMINRVEEQGQDFVGDLVSLWQWHKEYLGNIAALGAIVQGAAQEELWRTP